jgi:hypothetical protein
MTAPTINRERLARILGMMGSDHDGEALAAARLAERLRREADATWSEIIVPTLPPPDDPAPAFRTPDDAIDYLRDHPDLLTPWERGFIRSLAERRRARLSDKQLAVLARLAVKCRRSARAAP